MKNYLYDKYKKNLIEQFQLAEKEFDEDLLFWVKKFGSTERSKKDFIWSMFNRILFALPNKYVDVELYTIQ